MTRWVFNILAGASVALAVLTAGLWVRSYWVLDRLKCTTSRWFVSLGSTRGDVYLRWVRSDVGGQFPEWSHYELDRSIFEGCMESLSSS